MQIWWKIMLINTSSIDVTYFFHIISVHINTSSIKNYWFIKNINKQKKQTYASKEFHTI